MKMKCFKNPQEKQACQVCGAQVGARNSIKVTTTDYRHRYAASNRPWRNMYVLKVCPKCFDKILKKFENINLI